MKRLALLVALVVALGALACGGDGVRQARVNTDGLTGYELEQAESINAIAAYSPCGNVRAAQWIWRRALEDPRIPRADLPAWTTDLIAAFPPEYRGRLREANSDRQLAGALNDAIKHMGCNTWIGP